MAHPYHRLARRLLASALLALAPVVGQAAAHPVGRAPHVTFVSAMDTHPIGAKLTVGHTGVKGSSQLSYHGGPVNTGLLTYEFSWNPSNNSVGCCSYNNELEGGVGSYYTAQASEQIGNPLDDGVEYDLTQYCDARGYCPGGSYQVIVPQGSLYQTDAATNDCTNPGFAFCVSSNQVAGEIERVRERYGWPTGLDVAYTIILNPTTGDCFSGSGRCFGTPSGFCGYHGSYTVGGQPVLFAVIPWESSAPQAGASCDTGSYPANGDDYPDHAADMMDNTMSHESAEIMTNPLGNAWYNSANGMEVGDQCNFIFGATLGTSQGYIYDVSIGQTGYPDHPFYDFYIQTEWSNQTSTCTSYGTGP